MPMASLVVDNQKVNRQAQLRRGSFLRPQSFWMDSSLRPKCELPHTPFSECRLAAIFGPVLWLSDWQTVWEWVPVLGAHRPPASPSAALTFPPGSRAKYRELIKQVSLDTTDEALLSRISRKKSKAEVLMKRHFEALPVVAPGLAHLQLKGTDALEDLVVFPSSYNAEERERFQLQSLASMEITL